MIKSKKDILLTKILGFVSSGVSYIFTISLLMSFASNNFEKLLYLLCGIIIDGVKWFTLVTLIKYHKAKFYNLFNFIYHVF